MVLTIMASIFIPLTLLFRAYYGMNFEYIPELKKFRMDTSYVWGLMIANSLLVYFLFTLKERWL